MSKIKSPVTTNTMGVRNTKYNILHLPGLLNTIDAKDYRKMYPTKAKESEGLKRL